MMIPRDAGTVRAGAGLAAAYAVPKTRRCSRQISAEAGRKFRWSRLSSCLSPYGDERAACLPEHRQNGDADLHLLNSAVCYIAAPRTPSQGEPDPAVPLLHPGCMIGAGLRDTRPSAFGCHSGTVGTRTPDRTPAVQAGSSISDGAVFHQRMRW